jgi:site-specific DNA recombinase
VLRALGDDRGDHRFLDLALRRGSSSTEGVSRQPDAQGRGKSGNIYGYYKCRGRQEGFCDLPHIRIQSIERAVEEHYSSLSLRRDFTRQVEADLTEALAEEGQLVATTHANLQRQLTALSVKEDNLLDLAGDAALPRDKIRDRLRAIALERSRVAEALANVSRELALGATVLRLGVELSTEPQRLYRRHQTTSAVRSTRPSSTASS